jgi:hypothetical protein
MVRFRAISVLLLAMAFPSIGQARKPLSTAHLAPMTFKPTTLLKLDLPVKAANPCRVCGSGIPDARLGHNTFLGADAANDRLRLYVKRDFRQVTVDVSTNSALVGYGFRF